MDTETLVVLCTTPSGESAAQIARSLVERKLAACVNIVPNVTSVYRWKGTIESDKEQMLIIKTRQELLQPLQQAILELHPYELPEIIGVPITAGSQAYLSWIQDNTSG